MHGVDTERVPRNFVTRSAFPSVTPSRYVKWNAPLAAATAAFVNGLAGPNTTTFTYARTGAAPYKTSGGGSISGIAFGGTVPAGVMDCPRNVVVTVTHASAVVALSGIIYGQDEYGHLIQEAWSVTATGTSKVYTGKKAFAVVDGITVIGATDASADVVSVGTGSVLGLPSRNAVAGTDAAVKETIDGVVAITGTLTAAGVDPADAQGTFLAATIPNATHNYEVWYLEVDPQL